jgi:hypothetical protein
MLIFFPIKKVILNFKVANKDDCQGSKRKGRDMKVTTNNIQIDYTVRVYLDCMNWKNINIQKHLYLNF